MIPRCAILALTLAAGTIPFLEIGCGSPKALPNVLNSPYSGPAVSLDSTRGSYVVVVQSPTPGWEPTLDRVADQYKHKAVFITLRRPNPAFFYPQVIVQQQVGTSVAPSEHVKVYVRILNFDERGNDQPYTLAAEQQASAPAP
jgi:hypothetical protein